MQGASSTLENIVVSHHIKFMRFRSVLPFDVTALQQEMQFLQRRISSARVTVVFVGVRTVLSLNSNRFKCL